LVVSATFVDSSVIIDHLRGHTSPQVAELRRRLGLHEIVIGDLVLMEVLQGIRDPVALRLTDQTLAAFPCVDLVGARRARSAALAYRRLRRDGVTPRSSIDVLIASYCVDEGLELLSSDRDHNLMVPILDLRLWEAARN
jgi:predicted nucleic acid-binding protein